MGRRFSLATLVLVSLGACKTPAPGSDAVARVNGEIITHKEFDELVERNLRRYGGETQALPQGIRSRIEEGVLRRMVDDLMVEQRCKKEGLAIDDKELEQHFAEHQARFRSPQAFADYLSRSDTSEAALRDDLRKSLLRDRLVDKLTGTLTISDDEVAQYYRDNLGHFTEPQKMHVRRLLLRTGNERTPGPRANAAMKLARKLHDRAKAHPNVFAELCKKHSDGPEAVHGGSMGVVTTGRMPELDKLMANGLAAQAIGPVTSTAQGLEIYQVSDVVPEHVRPLASESNSIREALLMRRRNDRRQDVLRSLKEGSNVDLLITLSAPPSPVPAGAPPAANPVPPNP